MGQTSRNSDDVDDLNSPVTATQSDFSPTQEALNSLPFPPPPSKQHEHHSRSITTTASHHIGQVEATSNGPDIDYTLPTPREVMQDLPSYTREHIDTGQPSRRRTADAPNASQDHVGASQSPTSGVRLGERVIGRNQIWCGGRCLLGPEHKMSIVAFSMIVTPSIIFDCFTIPWFSNNQGIGTALGLLFPSLLLQTLSLVAFFSTVCADPGIIPRERNPLNSFDVNVASFRDHVPPKHQDIVINGHLFKLKYCSTCNIYRSPRTVHCSVCDNCVEKFDHHCPWVGNCIGKRNYRRFYFFICFTSLLVVFVMLASVVKDGIVITERISTEGSFAAAFTSIWPEAWDSMLLAIFTFGIMWFVVGLWAYHTYLIYANQTTYEHIKNYYEGEINPWDRGGLGNVYETLCTRSRPRYFDTKNLNAHRTIFEPKDIEANPPVDIEESPKTSRTMVQQSPEKSCGGRTTVCGIEICSVAEIGEATTSGIGSQQPSQTSQQQLEIEELIPQSSLSSTPTSETRRHSRGSHYCRHDGSPSPRNRHDNPYDSQLSPRTTSPRHDPDETAFKPSQLIQSMKSADTTVYFTPTSNSEVHK